MEITNNNLHKAIAALRRCAEENKSKQTDTGSVVISDICTDVADYLEKPADGRDKHLYRIKNKIGEFYIVARSFDEAADELMERLNNANYGYFLDRNVPNIEHLAEESFYDDKQVFSDDEANLIVIK